jgi:uncharacterized protein YdeI (YjbR/CyaY-like superfamily)
MPASPPDQVEPADRAAWRRWLLRHHARPEGVWVVLAKKGPDGLRYEEAVEEALCVGWIDSKPGTIDERRFRLWFSPRKPGSAWSKVNKERIERLVAGGRMRPAGQAKIDAAKADGSWNRLNASDALEMPDDLVEALSGYPDVRRHWDAFPPGVRKQILEWIGSAKRPATRETRVTTTARLAQDDVRANQWRPDRER